jgi:undecaprenyl-diphosphatase
LRRLGQIPSARGAILVAGSMTLLFLALAAAFSLGVTQGPDTGVLLFLRAHSRVWLTGLMTGLSWLGTEAAVTVCVLVFVWLNRRDRRLDTYAVVVAAAGGGLLTFLVKSLFHRPRPALIDPLAVASGFSFPSGHALIALVLYGTLGYVLAGRARSRGAARLIFISTAVLVGGIGLSRLYLGVHYATDVIAGYALGIAWVAMVALGRDLLLKRGTSTPAGASGDA